MLTKIKIKYNNRKGFTLIELLVVVAIIGILAAVGVTAFSGFQESAKINASKTNYKNVTKWIRTELVKCNAGLADKIFTSNPQSCPMTHANNFASGMNSACRGQNGVFAGTKNPYDSNERMCRLSISYTNDNDVGYINWSTKSAKEIRISGCWKTPCSSSANREEIIIEVTQ